MDARRRFLADETGQGLVEYALVISLVAIVCIVSLLYFGTRTNRLTSNSSVSIPG